MIGKIDTSQLDNPPEEHELETAKLFAAQGKNIVFINPSGIPNLHTPDIIMDNLEWEIKSPQGSGKRTIETNFRKAVKQSKNIIFDLRRSKLPEKQCVDLIEKEFKLRQYLKKLYIITKDNEIHYYVK